MRAAIPAGMPVSGKTSWEPSVNRQKDRTHQFTSPFKAPLPWGEGFGVRAAHHCSTMCSAARQARVLSVNTMDHLDASLIGPPSPPGPFPAQSREPFPRGEGEDKSPGPNRQGSLLQGRPSREPFDVSQKGRTHQFTSPFKAPLPQGEGFGVRAAHHCSTMCSAARQARVLSVNTMGHSDASLIGPPSPPGPFPVLGDGSPSLREWRRNSLRLALKPLSPGERGLG